jgi:hypothetical protein
MALNEDISAMPGMMPSWRSNGCAMDEAMVSALAPGMPAQTQIVGRSTFGRAAIGRRVQATAPISSVPTASSSVATGRRTKGADNVIA